HPHVVQLAARQANVEGGGEVTLTDLVRNALRMRPDRLVVGECRGAEVRDMLTALNTGHEGGCATIHANTADAVPSRVAALGALANMSPPAVYSQFSTAIDLVVHLRRTGSERGVTELAIPTRTGADGVAMEPVWGRPSPSAGGTINRRALQRFEPAVEPKSAGASSLPPFSSSQASSLPHPRTRARVCGSSCASTTTMMPGGRRADSFAEAGRRRIRRPRDSGRSPRWSTAPT